MIAITTMSAFDLDNEPAYQQWREQKLSWAADTTLLEPVEISPHPSRAELLAIRERCDKRNFALYRLRSASSWNKQAFLQLGQALGLKRLDSNLCADTDSVTSLQVVNSGQQQRYIPYTNKPLSWHTDGYYNPSSQQIHAFMLHCCQAADSGGANQILDHELAYILLRDQNPDYIAALQDPQTLSIPPNEIGDEQVRGWQHGPVFSRSLNGGLHMRFSARQRNIQWQSDRVTTAAVTALNTILDSSPLVINHRLADGEGLISRNILHRREGFSDSPSHTRLFWRARFFDALQFHWSEAAA